MSRDCIDFEDLEGEMTTLAELQRLEGSLPDGDPRARAVAQRIVAAKEEIALKVMDCFAAWALGESVAAAE